MSVLVDFHHTDLYRSFVRLFENRLGMKVYFPGGVNFFEDGHIHPDLKGSLDVDLKNKDLHPPISLAGVRSHYPYALDCVYWGQLTVWEMKEVTHIVSSFPGNFPYFKKLRDTLAPKAKLILYVGNEGELVSSNVSGWDLLLSADGISHTKKSNNPSVIYHPEFDTEVYTFPKTPQLELQLTPFVIRSFLNFLYKGLGLSDRELWKRHSGSMPDMDWYMHGLGTPPTGFEYDPQKQYLWEVVKGTKFSDRKNWPNLLKASGEPTNHIQISGLMKASNFIWHLKSSDGYGYVIHQAAACGRPIICRPTDYTRGKNMGGYLLENGVTCVHVTGDVEEDKKILRSYTRGSAWYRMSSAIRERFCNLVNFDDEAVKIKSLL